MESLVFISNIMSKASLERPHQNLAVTHQLFGVLGFWLTSLLCIGGELAGVGSFAVAIGVGDRRQVTCYMLHMTCDM